VQIAVVGGGSWGTAFARLVARAGNATTLVCRDARQAAAIRERHRNPRYLYDIELPPELDAVSTEDADLSRVELCAMAVPSRAFGAVAAELAPRVADGAAWLSLTKGLEPAGQRRMSELLEEIAGRERVAVLSGPNHAEEVARDLPTASVLAAYDDQLARRLQGVVNGPSMRIYTSDDVIGVEMCAAAKNVIAIAAGASDGMGFGDNAKAAIVTRGMAEMARLGEAFGAQQRTYSGMAGMGDLIATCTSRHSRNRRAGELLAKGVPPEWVEQEIGQVAEGLSTTPALHALADRCGLDLPIALAVDSVASGQATVTEALIALMAREPTSE
jgi:glycerol-3-phosphate dehydrogenase (NAD(P)+)